MPQFDKKKALIALRSMYQNAKSISEVMAVKGKCKLNNVKYHLLSVDDSTFNIAIELNQVEDFYYS